MLGAAWKLKAATWIVDGVVRSMGRWFWHCVFIVSKVTIEVRNWHIRISQEIY